jgi:hypothetical protein
MMMRQNDGREDGISKMVVRGMPREFGFEELR